MSAVSVDAVERAFGEFLNRQDLEVIFRDPACGRDFSLPIQATASAAGWLPVFVVAGESIWREMTGKGFELCVVRDPEALSGYRLRSIGAGSFATVMLATMEAAAQATSPGARTIVVNDLNFVWAASNERNAPSTDARSNRTLPTGSRLAAGASP